MKIEIKKDLFDISKRIKKINKNIKIKYDLNKRKYELFINDEKKVFLTIPYQELDERTLIYLSKHLKTSNEKILEEIELENHKRENQINEKIILEAINRAEKILRRS